MEKEKVLQTLFTLVQMRGQASGMVDLACSKYQPSGDLNSDVNILTWLDLHIFIVIIAALIISITIIIIGT